MSRRPEDRPLPRAPGVAVAAGARLAVVLAVWASWPGFAIMIVGLKLLDADVNRPSSDPTPQTAIPGH